MLGRSSLVGKPMAMLLLAENATVTLCHSKTRDLAAEIARADVLIADIGQPGFVRSEWIKGGAVVIDVGTSRLLDGKLARDVEFAAAAARASDRAGARRRRPDDHRVFAREHARGREEAHRGFLEDPRS